MTRIVLRNVWSLGAQFSAGGFAKVFDAKAEDGSIAVVKLIRKEPGASRELLFESLSGLPNIIPVLDSGEWKEYYVLVMPRAEKSLRELLASVSGKLSVDQALPVLKGVAAALASLTAGVVHRDLKPENVLLYGGQWCLADFGIARYADATTATDTHKYCMTPAYASPEQWRQEQATNATDIYSFGVMAFEILQGKLPFPGPAFREQHLGQAPPDLTDVPVYLSNLISECLYKPAEARPTPTNIRARLEGAKKIESPAAQRLQVLNRSAVKRQAVEAARVSAKKTREEVRSILLIAANKSFSLLLQMLRDRVHEAASSVHVHEHRVRLILSLEEGALKVESVRPAPADCLSANGDESPFDVIAYTAITAQMKMARSTYEGRAHSLWFFDAHDKGVYRWYELAFMGNVFVGESFPLNPFNLDPTDKLAGQALLGGSSTRQIAWQPLPFDQGDEEQFIERWMQLFGDAAAGSMQHPNHMPEDSGGRFRSPR